MKKYARLFASLLLVCFASPAARAQNLAADLIIVNARVRTMDDSKPSAEAVAVMGNRIVAVGANKDVRALAGARTRILDAKGRLAPPGFNDSHVHFLDGGLRLSSVDLRDAQSPQVFAERVRDFAAKLPKGRWITGGMWDHENWSPANLPTRELIDRVTPDRPVFVMRLDGHMALANSLALKLAGVNRDTKTPEGGEIVRDAQGDPSGVLKDAAMSYVYAVIPADTFERKTEGLRAATDYAASLGVTSVQDMSAATDLAVYQELIRQGNLKTRVKPSGWIPEQKISVEEAVKAYTLGSAYAEFQEGVKGTITTGKLADLVILSDDIFTMNPNDIGKTKSVTTVADGKIVYENPVK